MSNTNLQKAINEMLQMQDHLNTITSGADWQTGLTLQGRVIDWKRCIVMESAELIDSYPWKHWKSIDAAIDIKNAQIELVDIWHFLLSLALEHCVSVGIVDIFVNGLLQSQNKSHINGQPSVIEQVKVHEAMMRVALESGRVDASYITRLTNTFFNACQVLALNFEQLYQIYMAKNTLNAFRQDHGYKEGHYIKEWNGREDNVVMLEISNGLSKFSGEALYAALEKQYSQLRVEIN